MFTYLHLIIIRQKHRQRARETERQRDRETERQRDRETERQRDRETDRQYWNWKNENYAISTHGNGIFSNQKTIFINDLTV